MKSKPHRNHETHQGQCLHSSITETGELPNDRDGERGTDENGLFERILLRKNIQETWKNHRTHE